MDEDDLLRARVYGLLGHLLARPPRRALLDELAGLRGTETPLGRALDELGRRCAAVREEDAELEYNALFIGVDRGELVPYASYYLTGFLNDRPLAQLRRDLGRLGIEPIPSVAEPEDHIAALCEIMAGLITGSFGPGSGSGEAAFFRRHLAPWAGRFFEDLERARAAVVYRPVGTIGRLFMEFEEDLQAPRPVEGGQVPAEMVRLGDGGRQRP